MNCGSCGKRTGSNDLCMSCSANAVEKRAKKTLSKSGILKDSGIMVVNDGSCEGEVNANLVKKLVTATKNIKYVKNIPENSSSYDFISIPDTADTQAEELMDFMLNANAEKSPAGAVRLLKDSLGSEVAAYAKTKRIKYRKRETCTDVAALIYKLENRCKGTIHALAKASGQVKWRK